MAVKVEGIELGMDNFLRQQSDPLLLAAMLVYWCECKALSDQCGPQHERAFIAGWNASLLLRPNVF